MSVGSGALARFFDGDVWHSFRSTPVAVAAALVAFVLAFSAIFAGWVAPHNPFDLATLELSDARLPPAWIDEGSSKYLLGTDDQGRDILSALMYGARISLLVGVASVLLSVVVGVGLGLLFIQAVQFADIPVMAAYLCLIALIFVVINLIVVMLYFAVDPRLRIDKSTAGH